MVKEHVKADKESAKGSLKSAEYLHLMPFVHLLMCQERLSGADGTKKTTFRNSAKYDVNKVFEGCDHIFDRKADGVNADAVRITESAEGISIKAMNDTEMELFGA